MLIFAPEMAKDCIDIDVVLRQINQRLRKLEKSDSEKNEEIGRLNRLNSMKDVKIHSLEMNLLQPSLNLPMPKIASRNSRTRKIMMTTRLAHQLS